MVKTFKEGGMLAFYKGFQANANRLVTWTVITFVSLMKIRKQLFNRFYKHKN